jgi:choice-of-anchor A domain-containing protein
MTFDWRLAVPVVMNAITKHLLVMASSSPTYQCDSYFTPLIQRHIAVLQMLHDEMLKNVHCNWKLNNVATPYASVLTMCADVNTGLASQLVESDSFCPITLYKCPELGGGVNSVPDDYDMTKCSIGTGGCRASDDQFTWAHANPTQIAANIKLLRSQVIAGMPVQAVEDAIAALKGILATSCLPPTLDTSAWSQGPAGTSGQSYPRDFNAFAQQGVSGLRDVQGSLAGGGAINLSSMNINPLKRPVGIVSGGSLTLKYGTVYGAIYEGAGGNLTSVSYDRSKVYSSSPIGFDSAFQQLATFSSQVAGLKNAALPNSTYVGSKSTPYYGNLKLSSQNPVLSVFNLTASDFVNTYQIEFAVPATSTVIVNVGGTAPVVLQNAGLKLGGLSPSKMLWNFPEASSVTVQSVGMNGSILAPNATLNLKYGHEYGTIVGKSIASDTELYEAPFKGNWLVP